MSELISQNLSLDQTATNDHVSKKRIQKRVMIIIAAVFAALILAYVGAAWVLSDRVPRGATVAGINVGSMTSGEAKAVLTSDLLPATEEPIKVVVGQVEGDVYPAEAGLKFDVDATVDSIVGFNLSPVWMWEHIVGASAVTPVGEVDKDLLRSTIEGMAQDFAVAPIDGAIQFEGANPVTTPAQDGLQISVDPAVDLVTTDWIIGSKPLVLPSEPVSPAISDEEVARALADDANPLISGPIVVSVEEKSIELEPEVLASATTFVPEGDSLKMVINGDLLVEDLHVKNPELETVPLNATISLGADGPQITADTPGTKVDSEALVTSIVEAIHTEERTIGLSFVEVEADLTAAGAEALGIRERVSLFSSPLTSDPVRTNNIRIGAASINGVVVMPGETFSLLDTLGPITAEYGFGEAPIILNGSVVGGVGGGLSQLATSVYNAAFFAGLEDVEHKPHSQHFGRYPEGREATIYVPDIDLKFRNDTEYGVLIESWISDGHIHVAIWSTTVWDIRTETSERREIVQPKTIQSNSPDCVPSASAQPGFLVTVTRYFYQNDQLIKQESQNWRYQPVNPVECVKD